MACSGTTYDHAIDDLGYINLWDIRHSGRRSLWKLEQIDVACIDFCPLEKQLLATSGGDGIKVWNTASGTVKANISILNDEITCLLWSPFRKEILFAHNNFLSLASFSSDEGHVLAKWEHFPKPNIVNDCDGFTGILSLHHLRNGKVVSIDTERRLCEHTAFLDQKPSEDTQNLINPEFSTVIR